MGYRHYYRGPYYRRRHYYRYRDPSSCLKNLALKFILFLGAIVLMIIFTSSKNPFYGVLGFILSIGALIWIIRRIAGNRSVRPSVNNIDQLSQRDIAQINSEKHEQVYYAEGLSQGEQEVAHVLSSELSYKDYFIFNNLILPAENNGSTQIDHIVVSRFGIFVIESKDYSGWIFGDKDQPFWTQSLPGGDNKFSFQNPIHQNYAHIMALKVLMPFAADSIYSIVIFSSKSEFKTDLIENVVHLDQLIGNIKKYYQEKLTENEVQLVIGKLSYARQTVDISASEHVANLQANRPV